MIKNALLMAGLLASVAAGIWLAATNAPTLNKLLNAALPLVPILGLGALAFTVLRPRISPH